MTVDQPVAPYISVHILANLFKINCYVNSNEIEKNNFFIMQLYIDNN